MLASSCKTNYPNTCKKKHKNHKLPVQLNNVFTGREFFWLLCLLSFISWWFALIDECIQPKRRQRDMRIQLRTFDPCSFTSHEVWMYCTFFGLQWFHCMTPSHSRSIFLLLIQVLAHLQRFVHKYQRPVNGVTRRHCDEKILRRTLRWVQLVTSV